MQVRALSCQRRGQRPPRAVVVDHQHRRVGLGQLGQLSGVTVCSRRARSRLQAITTLRAYRPLPATSSAVPESVGTERNRAASASNSGRAASAIAIFLPAICRAIATISSAVYDSNVSVK
jgi:hypothetical protein